MSEEATFWSEAQEGDVMHFTRFYDMAENADKVEANYKFDVWALVRGRRPANMKHLSVVVLSGCKRSPYLTQADGSDHGEIVPVDKVPQRVWQLVADYSRRRLLGEPLEDSDDDD